jgi:YVTN family beta-propeller protein
VNHNLSGTVSVLDTESNTVVSTIPVGSLPYSIAISRISHRRGSD